jgi:predicted aspartyl protease
MGGSAGKGAGSHRARGWAQRCALAVLIAAGYFGAPGAAFGFGGPDRTEPPAWPRRDGLSATLPFKLYKRYAIVVVGTIGSLGPMHFLVDTGTDPSLLDLRTAQALGLRGVREAMQVFNGKLPVERVAIPSLEVGPVHQRWVPAVISDLRFMDGEVGAHVDAIIGLAVLGGGNFTIDYKRKEIVFGPVEDKAAVPFVSGPLFVTVKVSFGGQPLSLLVDTGTSGLVLFRSHIKGKLDKVQTDVYAQARNIRGNFGYETIILPNTRMGRQDLGPVAAFVVQDKPGPSEFGGLMGIPLIHPRRLSFDFEKHMLSWAGSW